MKITGVKLLWLKSVQYKERCQSLARSADTIGYYLRFCFSNPLYALNGDIVQAR